MTVTIATQDGLIRQGQLVHQILASDLDAVLSNARAEISPAEPRRLTKMRGKFKGHGASGIVVFGHRSAAADAPATRYSTPPTRHFSRHDETNRESALIDAD